MRTEIGDMTIVHVALPDELVDVWRPVKASLMAPGLYRLDEYPNYDPTLERWEFPPGSTVRCESRELDGQTRLVAVSFADDTEQK